MPYGHREFPNLKHECRCLGNVTKEIFEIQFLKIEFGINFGRK